MYHQLMPPILIFTASVSSAQFSRTRHGEFGTLRPARAGACPHVSCHGRCLTRRLRTRFQADGTVQPCRPGRTATPVVAGEAHVDGRMEAVEFFDGRCLHRFERVLCEFVIPQRRLHPHRPTKFEKDVSLRCIYVRR